MKVPTFHRTLLGALVALWAMAASGCKSTYYSAQFIPSTQEVYVGSESNASARARALVSVVGVRKEDRSNGFPTQVEIRMRLENLGEVPFHLEQHSLELLSGDFVPFSAAQVSSGDAPRIEPNGAANYELSFPMPEGRSQDETHFGSLSLRFTLAFEEEAITTGVHFERDWPRRAYYYDPYYDPYWPTVRFHYGYARFGYGYGYGCW